MFEIFGAPPPPRPRPHHRPRRRIYGTFPSVPVYYYPDTRVIEIETAAPELPWRVTQYNSWGESVLFKSASMQDALRFYRKKSRNWKSTQVGFNVNLNLQHWTGTGWKTEATMNSQDWLKRR